MKILAIHADFIEFTAKKKAFKGAEEGVEKGKTTRVEECLVAFTAFEKTDESNVQAIVKRYVHEVRKIAQQVNAENIVLYPYAHLSANLGDPKLAVAVMKQAQEILKEEYKVSRAPFGWYKSFNISCKGHPLSELSREFGPQEKENSSLKRVSKDEPFSFNNKELTKADKVNFSTAALLAKAVKDLYPAVKIGSLGFYHDQAYVDIAQLRIGQDMFKKIEKKMKYLREEDLVFAKTQHVDDELQKDILKDLGDTPAYQLNDLQFVPNFKEPFIHSTKEIGAFKIINTGSAYWKNNDQNPQLSRVYVVGFTAQEELEQFHTKLEEARNRSHVKIGKEQGLFVVSKLVGAGLPLLAPNGMIIREEIVKYLWDLHKDKGYKRVWTPHIAKDALYKKSGHWEKFGDELFKVQGTSESFVMKPMNCPHHMQIFDHFSFSYRDMPIRYFEPATVYRDEKSGQLVGLSRVRAITQDDGHLFCRRSQIKDEVGAIVGIIGKFYATLGMDKEYWVSLSVRSDDHSKYIGEDEVWVAAEEGLEEAARENNLPYKKIKGEAAFYGPKLDFVFKDALGREQQLATIQLDFTLPERFDLSYMNEEGKKERPIVIHRAISGSLERFMSVLIEHFAGKFPLWLSPTQVKIVTVTDRSNDFALNIIAKMNAHGLRAEIDGRSETMAKKVRDAQIQKVNYIITIGDKEVENNTLAIRTRAGQVKHNISVDQFVAQLVKERDEKAIGDGHVM